MSIYDDLMEAAKKGDWSKVNNLVDIGIRHKEAKPSDYLKQWLKIGRCFGYATHDDSYGEFEKEFAIIIIRLLKAEAKASQERQA